MLALMRPRKGVEIALDAMQLLKRTGIPIRLNLIGAFETEAYEQLILGKIRDLEIGDCVSWKGFTNDVATAIGQLDALLLPSLFGEGMPMVVLEALSAGVPVIATRVEGTPEVIRDGIEGYLAEPGKPRELADSVVRLCSNRIAWSEMSCRAVSRHRTNYTDSLMASRVAGVYRRALAITT
jgi:glycosyltransferase involved in cell wall biosynthesis